uniref:Uncharacterized protein n=1 Tax=Setaria viridis TaxID=4556 RepID=A0A4U6WBL2_SETVI|nr:hypothetical protein SEVIR_1G155266v2 [Setaria viridis]
MLKMLVCLIWIPDGMCLCAILNFGPCIGDPIVWRCLGDIAIVWLTKLFNYIFRLNKMSEEWRSILVPTYKNKGDIQSCTNY